MLIMKFLFVMILMAAKTSRSSPINKDGDVEIAVTELMLTASPMPKEYDELIEEEGEIETSSSPSYVPTLDELKSYQRLFINDFQIMLDEDGKDVIVAKYRDDIQFECDMPSQYVEADSNDWKLNNFTLRLHDTSYSIILDERAKTNNTFLNASCLFRLIGQDEPIELKFPPINLDAYNFEYYVSQNAYLKMKYEKQITIFNISIIVVLVLAVVVVLLAWIYQIRVRNHAKYADYVLAE